MFIVILFWSFSTAWNVVFGFCNASPLLSTKVEAVRVLGKSTFLDLSETFFFSKPMLNKSPDISHSFATEEAISHLSSAMD